MPTFVLCMFMFSPLQYILLDIINICPMPWWKLNRSFVPIAGFILCMEGGRAEAGGIFVNERDIFVKTDKIVFRHFHHPGHSDICWPQVVPRYRYWLELCKRLIGEVIQSCRRPLLGPSRGWKRLLPLSHLRHYWDTMLYRRRCTVQ